MIKARKLKRHNAMRNHYALFGLGWSHSVESRGGNPEGVFEHPCPSWGPIWAPKTSSELPPAPSIVRSIASGEHHSCNPSFPAFKQIDSASDTFSGRFSVFPPPVCDPVRVRSSVLSSRVPIQSGGVQRHRRRGRTRRGRRRRRRFLVEDQLRNHP